MNLGAPGLEFETWEATNLSGRGTRAQIFADCNTNACVVPSPRELYPYRQQQNSPTKRKKRAVRIHPGHPFPVSSVNVSVSVRDYFLTASFCSPAYHQS